MLVEPRPLDSIVVPPKTCPVAIGSSVKIPQGQKNTKIIEKDQCLVTLYGLLKTTFVAKKRSQEEVKDFDAFLKNIIDVASEESLMDLMFDYYQKMNQNSTKKVNKPTDFVGPPEPPKTTLRLLTSNPQGLDGLPIDNILSPVLGTIAAIVTNNNAGFRECDTSDRCAVGYFAVTPKSYYDHRLGNNGVNLGDFEVNKQAALKIMGICGKKHFPSVKKIIECYLGPKHPSVGKVFFAVTGGN